MTTIRQIASVILAAVLLSTFLQGQEITGTPRPQQYVDERAGISLEAAIARALEHEPALRAARSDIDVAAGQRQQAGLRPNPSLTFEQRTEPAGTDSATTVGVEWPLDLFRRQGRVRTAEHQLTVTQLAIADRERLLAAEVRMRYGRAAAAARDVAIADELVVTLQRQLDLARARAAEGSIPPLERDLLDVEVRRLQAERVRASGRADVAMIELKELLGFEPDHVLMLRENLEALVSQGPAVAASDRGPADAERRSDVREAEARVALAEASVDQARREGRVDASLFSSYMRMDAGFPQRAVGSTGGLERVRGQFNYLAGGAMIKLPLLNRNQGQVAAAQAERSGAVARRDAAAFAARADVAAAHALDARAQESLALYSGDTRDLARKNLDVVRQTFDLGRATLLDVLAEQRRYLDFERAYTTALREAWEARAALKSALGETK